MVRQIISNNVRVMNAIKPSEATVFDLHYKYE